MQPTSLMRWEVFSSYSHSLESDCISSSENAKSGVLRGLNKDAIHWPHQPAAVDVHHKFSTEATVMQKLCITGCDSLNIPIIMRISASLQRSSTTRPFSSGTMNLLWPLNKLLIARARLKHAQCTLIAPTFTCPANAKTCVEHANFHQP